MGEVDNPGELTPEVEPAEGTLQAELISLREQVASLEKSREEQGWQISAFDQLDDAVIGVDLEQRIRYWNTAAERQYGFRRDEVAGKFLDQVYQIHWQTPQNVEIARRTLAETGHLRGESIHQKPDGERFYVESAVSRWYDQEGRWVGWLSVIRDVSRRKLQEEGVQFLSEASTLLSTSLNYETTLRGLAELAVPFLADWCVIYLSTEEQPLQLAGFSHAEPLQERLMEIWLNQSPLENGWESLVRQILRTSQPSIINPPALPALPPGLKAQSLLAAPLRYQEQNLGILLCGANKPRPYQTHHLKLVQELSHRAAQAIENSRLFWQTQQALEAQQALDTLKDQFLSIASHELRTPLATVKGYVQLLRRHRQKNRLTTLEPAQQNREAIILASVDQQLDRMNSLIEEMLDVTRIQSGQLDLQYDDDSDLVASARRVIEQYRDQAELTGHNLELVTGETALAGQFDTMRIEQVFSHLISNALKYSPPGTTVTLTIERAAARPEVLITVHDQGPGIEPGEQERIFQRFYHTQGQADTSEGLGLGLYITRQIVTRHGGRIWLESRSGVGSTFFVTLPLSAPGNS